MTRRFAAATASAIVLVLVGAGCGGGGGESSADAVTHYIEDMNLIQHDLELPLGEVYKANRELRSGGKLNELAPRLERSAKTIRRLERRLDALEPPKQAETLDSIIRRIVHEEWLLANEYAELARYSPAVTPILARATAAGGHVRQDLKRSNKPEPQAEALETYADSLDSVVHSLRQLEPPPVVAPEHATQIGTFTRVAASSRALAAALRRGTGQAAELHRLELALASSSTIKAQKARIAGIVAFNRRITHVRTLAANAERERKRVERRLRS